MNDSSCAFEIIHQTLQLSGNSISVSHLCQMAGVSRSVYYAWLKAAPIREEQERQDREDYDIILTAYGSRLVLLTDITYLPYNCTFTYLSTILDAYTKQILSYVLSDSLDVDFVLETVRQLINRHGTSLHAETIVHSDQGCHYTSQLSPNEFYTFATTGVYPLDIPVIPEQPSIEKAPADLAYTTDPDK